LRLEDDNAGLPATLLRAAHDHSLAIARRRIDEEWKLDFIKRWCVAGIGSHCGQFRLMSAFHLNSSAYRLATGPNIGGALIAAGDPGCSLTRVLDVKLSVVCLPGSLFSPQ